ncbi:MAG: hypothetical protein ACI8TL_001817 [Natronomonas sp.]|jgi:hypothetical protein
MSSNTHQSELERKQQPKRDQTQSIQTAERSRSSTVITTITKIINRDSVSSPGPWNTLSQPLYAGGYFSGEQRETILM